MNRPSNDLMAPSGPADQCPYAERHEFTRCQAHHVVSAEPRQASKKGAPELTCSFLIAGATEDGRHYPRCAIGTESARRLLADRRRDELQTIVGAALASESTSDRSERGVMVTDDDGRYLSVNPAMCRMLGYESDEMLVGKSVWDLTPMPHAMNGRAMWQAFVAAGESFGTYQLVCADGTLKTFDYSARANVIPGVHVSILTPASRRRRPPGRFARTRQGQEAAPTT